MDEIVLNRATDALTLNAEIRTGNTGRRLRISIRGAVQGVGFRPFIYRLAGRMGLVGWVRNISTGMMIEVEGEREHLEAFLLRIEREKPPLSFIQGMEFSYLDTAGYSGFEILESEREGEKSAIVLPDIAACPECVQEIFDSENRRYLYPFTNCIHCGPRFSILERLPYDRLNTVMKTFAMCRRCEAEYQNPSDRRFHAQANACPKCGPQLQFFSQHGNVLSRRERALFDAVEKIKQGSVVAVKGLGGFHLVADARSDRTVAVLRERKRREEKPFAVMYPNLEDVKRDCEVSAMEERLLCSPESPIVLLNKRNPWVTSLVAPASPCLGVLLPYTPLHHLLLKYLGFPIVATSGNFSEEPMVTDEIEAMQKLRSIADYFLVHDRPIKRPVDDSIVRIMAGREMVLRRARGFAPIPLTIKNVRPGILAVGAHLKSTVAVSHGSDITVSQHIGDLASYESFDVFKRTVEDCMQFREIRPVAAACDLHPDYRSTQFALDSGVKVIEVQHHYAHALACAAENDLDAPFLGVIWDGTGYGTDGTIWGGEFLKVSQTNFHRLASFRAFPLPGKEKAVREPRRVELGLLYEMFGEAVFEMDSPDFEVLKSFSVHERAILKKMLEQRISTVLTSSAGRLFDAVSSMVHRRDFSRFEAQAAMELEFAIQQTETQEHYPFRISSAMSARTFKHSEGCLKYPDYVIDWAPMIYGILKDKRLQVPAAVLSAKFHNTLAEIIVAITARAAETSVVLSGGCFQNKYLTERVIQRLAEEGVRPYWHQRIPPNDGGISLGQIVAATRALQEG